MQTSAVPVDSHVHTPLCGHASGAPGDYVRAAATRGIRHLTFTCHIPMSSAGFGGPRIRMDAAQLNEYQDQIAQAAQLGQTLGVEVLFGIEAEWFPREQELAQMDELLVSWPFDFVIGSVHPHLPIYQQWFRDQGISSDHDKAAVYFEHVLAAAECGRYDALAHLDIVRCYGTVQQFDPAAHEPAIRRILRALARLDTPLEINTSGLSKRGLAQLHPDPLILGWARDYPLSFTLGSDAHAPGAVGQHYAAAESLLAELSCCSIRLFRGRKAVEIPLQGERLVGA